MRGHYAIGIIVINIESFLGPPVSILFGCSIGISMGTCLCKHVLDNNFMVVVGSINGVSGNVFEMGMISHVLREGHQFLEPNYTVTILVNDIVLAWVEKVLGESLKIQIALDE